MLRRAFLLRAARPTVLPGNKSLKEHDPEMYELMQKELHRQVEGLELIASENFTSRAVLECLGSVATNKYAEGLPGARYYGGAQYVDQMENLCRKRALEAFRLDPNVWGVNVQPYSGSPANFAAYTAVLNPHDRLMGLDLPCGGHLTHGFYTAKKRISASSIFFESLPYRTNKATGLIDLDELEKLANMFKPKLIVVGGSAYPRDWEYDRFRKIADGLGAMVMVDMAHFSGLVAAGEHRNPFETADLVTSTTHKSLRGPRSGVIFFRKVGKDGASTGLEDKVNQAVFPALQGGPHMHQIAALATQLKEVATPEFKEYAKQVKANAKTLAAELTGKGYTLVSGGTDNHLMLWDFNPHNMTGSKMEKLFELAEITTNKNTVAGDKSAIAPGGLRLGTPALTTRGFSEADFKQVAEFLHRGAQIGFKINEPGMKLTTFVEKCAAHPEIQSFRKEVSEFARQFPFPGLENPFPCGH